MPKIKINAFIENDNEKDKITTQAIVSDNIIKYKENNNTIVIYDYQNNTLRRETDLLSIHYRFNQEKKTNGILNIKELNKDIHVNIKTNYIKRKENDIEIMYQVEDDTFLYHIEEIK